MYTECNLDVDLYPYIYSVRGDEPGLRARLHEARLLERQGGCERQELAHRGRELNEDAKRDMVHPYEMYVYLQLYYIM